MSDPLAQLPRAVAAQNKIELAEPQGRSSKRLRSFELLLVLFVAFAGSLAISLYTVFSGASLYGSKPSAALNFTGVIQEVAALGVLAYVLLRQGRHPAELGLTFDWKDFPLSIGLAFMAFMAELITWQLVSSGYRRATGHVLDTNPRNIEFIAGFSIWTIVLVIINPFFEELIVRAYLITEVGSLTGSAVIAVIVSVLLQATYHLYQGFTSVILMVAMFAVFSIYYARTRRIVPVILAHLYFDCMAVAYYWWR